eukprot:11880370-Karenia_brevis.AAC.1
MDANIDQKFECNLHSILLAYNSNMGSNRLPTWSGGGAFGQGFGLVLEASWGSRGVQGSMLIHSA